MSQERQCVKCKKRFNDSLRYCPKCRTYWKHGKQNRGWADSILSAEQNERNVVSDKQQREDLWRDRISLPERYLICDKCKKEIPVEGDALPLFCCYCNTMIDGLARINERRLTAENSEFQQTVAEEEKQQGATTKPSHLPERDPLNRGAQPPRPDDSTISFVWLRPGESRRLSKPNTDGVILLGTKGNYETEFFSGSEFSGVEERQAAIVHELTGWYMAVEGPNLRLNNVLLSLSPNYSYKLKNNDRINLGDCTLQVEILARTK